MGTGKAVGRTLENKRDRRPACAARRAVAHHCTGRPGFRPMVRAAPRDSLIPPMSSIDPMALVKKQALALFQAGQFSEARASDLTLRNRPRLRPNLVCPRDCQRSTRVCGSGRGTAGARRSASIRDFARQPFGWARPSLFWASSARRSRFSAACARRCSAGCRYLAQTRPSAGGGGETR